VAAGIVTVTEEVIAKERAWFWGNRFRQSEVSAPSEDRFPAIP
jgi:hypothetical protein